MQTSSVNVSFQNIWDQVERERDVREFDSGKV